MRIAATMVRQVQKVRNRLMPLAWLKVVQYHKALATAKVEERKDREARGKARKMAREARKGNK